MLIFPGPKCRQCDEYLRIYSYDPYVASDCRDYAQLFSKTIFMGNISRAKALSAESAEHVIKKIFRYIFRGIQILFS